MRPIAWDSRFAKWAARRSGRPRTFAVASIAVWLAPTSSKESWTPGRPSRDLRPRPPQQRMGRDT